MKGILHYTLRPVYPTLGIDWKPLPISLGKIILVLLALQQFINFLTLFL